MKFSSYATLTFLCLDQSNAFSTPKQTNIYCSQRCLTAPREIVTTTTSITMAGGEGGDTEWAKALAESSTEVPGAFEKEMKMKGLGGFGKGKFNPKLSANAKLLEWLEEQGDVYLSDQSTWGLAPHPMAVSTETIDETTNESTGRGLLARRNINEGDELLTIPMELCMTLKVARKALGEDVITDGMNEYLAIATHMIYERYQLKENSEMSAYFGVLPEVDEVNPTFTWSDEDLSFLGGSPVVAATQSMQAKLRREYDDLIPSLLERFPNRFSKEAFTYENWIWAFTMLFSRAIRLRNLGNGEALAMVPYADLINHSPFSGAYVDARQKGSWLFKEGTEEVILYADRSYRKMEQVYISYGPKSNGDLLLLYGFALERNPYNSVDVTVSIAPRTAAFVERYKAKVAAGEAEFIDFLDVDPLADEKLEFVENSGRDTTVDFPCYADRYPTEMLQYLRLMQMTSEDTRGKSLSEFDYTRTISAANEAAVLNSVIEAVKMQLRKYPSTEEQDAQLIKDKGMFKLFSYNQRMAVRHRRNEKRLLKRTVAALEKQIRSRGLLDEDILQRAGGNTGGEVLKGEGKFYGTKQRSALEERLEKMGLPVDLR